MKHLVKNTHYQSTGRENISVLVDNIRNLSDSQVQETVLKDKSTKGLIDNQTEQLLSDSLDGISKVLLSNKRLNNGRKLLVVTIVN